MCCWYCLTISCHLHFKINIVIKAYWKLLLRNWFWYNSFPGPSLVHRTQLGGSAFLSVCVSPTALSKSKSTSTGHICALKGWDSPLTSAPLQLSNWLAHRNCSLILAWHFVLFLKLYLETTPSQSPICTSAGQFSVQSNTGSISKELKAPQNNAALKKAMRLQVAYLLHWK